MKDKILTTKSYFKIVDKNLSNQFTSHLGHHNFMVKSTKS